MTAETEVQRGESKTIELRVSYNGVVKELEHVAPSETTQSMLQRAIALFPGIERPHQQALFREDGSEVPADQTVSGVRLHNEELLILRPRTVQGG